MTALERNINKYFVDKLVKYLDKEVIPKQYDRLFLQENNKIRIYIRNKDFSSPTYSFLVAINESDAFQVLMEDKAKIRVIILRQINKYKFLRW